MRPEINKHKCRMQVKTCKVFLAYPQDAILYTEDKKAPLGDSITIDYEKCDRCGIRVTECCGAVIDII